MTHLRTAASHIIRLAIACCCVVVPALHAQTAPDSPSDPGMDSEPEPGQLVVDEEAALRALESALVQADALLLPPATFEFSLSFDYTVDATRTSFLLATTDDEGNAAPALANSQFESRSLVAMLDLQLGLPFGFQIGTAVPYGWRSSNEDINFDGAVLDRLDDSTDGVGDVEVSLQKTLLRERGALPDIVLSAMFDTDSGDEQRGFADGSRSVAFSLGITKRQDPLVFTGSVGHSQISSGARDSASDGLTSYSLAAYLGASPRTSLRMEFRQARLASSSDGQGGRRSRRTLSELSLGVTSVITRRSTLSASVNAGLTEDAADASFGLRWTRNFLIGR